MCGIPGARPKECGIFGVRVHLLFLVTAVAIGAYFVVEGLPGYAVICAMVAADAVQDIADARRGRVTERGLPLGPRGRAVALAVAACMCVWAAFAGIAVLAIVGAMAVWEAAWALVDGRRDRTNARREAPA